MSDRLQYHEEAAASRDQRFTGYGRRKMSAWSAEVRAWYDGDCDPEVREHLKLTRWAECGCGRPFQPGERNYGQCYTCNQTSYADGSTACAICQRRHSMAFPCCKICQTNGMEETATPLRSLVLRRDGYACRICETSEGQLDVHHIDPAGSAWQWNVEILCVPCWVTFNASRAFGPLDELAWLELAGAYDSYLNEYLNDDERVMLRQQLHETLGSDFRAKPPRNQWGQCEEVQGMLNVLDAFGREGIVVEHA
jgi:hypothetical protein